MEAESNREELLTPSNIKREKVDDDDKEGSAKKRRKTTNNEESGNSNNINNISSNNTNNSINDSYAQFGQSVANHLRESNLSKGQLLVLQGEILATIAKHVA